MGSVLSRLVKDELNAVPLPALVCAGSGIGSIGRLKSSQVRAVPIAILLCVWLLGCASSGPPTPPPQEGGGALQALRDWNNFMQRTLDHIASLPNDEARRRFVNELRPTMEYEVGRWKRQHDADLRDATLNRSRQSPAYIREVERSALLAPRLTRQLEKYADKSAPPVSNRP